MKKIGSIAELPGSVYEKIQHINRELFEKNSQYVRTALGKPAAYQEVKSEKNTSNYCGIDLNYIRSCIIYYNKLDSRKICNKRN